MSASPCKREGINHNMLCSVWSSLPRRTKHKRVIWEKQLQTFSLIQGRSQLVRQLVHCRISVNIKKVQYCFPVGSAHNILQALIRFESYLIITLHFQCI